MIRSFLKLESSLYWCGSGVLQPRLGSCGTKDPASGFNEFRSTRLGGGTKPNNWIIVNYWLLGFAISPTTYLFIIF